MDRSGALRRGGSPFQVAGMGVASVPGAEPRHCIFRRRFAFRNQKDKEMRSDNWLRGVLLAACTTMVLAAPALAQKSADTLRITWRDAIPDVNPYYNSQ